MIIIFHSELKECLLFIQIIQGFHCPLNPWILPLCGGQTLKTKRRKTCCVHSYAHFIKPYRKFYETKCTSRSTRCFVTSGGHSTARRPFSTWKKNSFHLDNYIYTISISYTGFGRCCFSCLLHYIHYLSIP